MTDAVNEQLSACLDGELPAAELDLLLKRLERDSELRAALGRYAAVGEAMRHARPAVASRSFADKVMAAVEQEPAAAARRASRLSPVVMRRLRPIAGVGIAATVAALAIFSVQRTGEVPQTIAVNEPAAAPVAVAQNVDDGSSYVVPTTTSQPVFVPATRLTNYVVAHSEYSSPLARRSVLTGVLAEDDGDPDVAPARDDETRADETRKDQSQPAAARSQ